MLFWDLQLQIILQHSPSLTNWGQECWEPRVWHVSLLCTKQFLTGFGHCYTTTKNTLVTFTSSLLTVSWHCKKWLSILLNHQQFAFISPQFHTVTRIPFSCLWRKMLKFPNKPSFFHQWGSLIKKVLRASLNYFDAQSNQQQSSAPGEAGCGDKCAFWCLNRFLDEDFSSVKGVMTINFHSMCTRSSWNICYYIMARHYLFTFSLDKRKKILLKSPQVADLR